MQANRAKSATDDLYLIFANKAHLSEISSSIVDLARPKMKLVEDTLLQILETLVEHPPLAWLVRAKIFPHNFGKITSHAA